MDHPVVSVGAEAGVQVSGPSQGRTRVALVYDMDACRGPTGVTRHALAQLERLARRPEVGLSVVSGRGTRPGGGAYWPSLGDLPRAAPPLRPPARLRWGPVGP